MRLYRFFFGVFFLIFVFSCSNKNRLNDSPFREIPLDMPLKQEAPVLRIVDYKNRNERVAITPWLRNYLNRGISGVESLTAYRGSYCFIASIYNNKLPVISQWIQNYSLERDFSRLVAKRIQNRLERDLPGKPPGAVYGPNYEQTLIAAYGNRFRGALQLSDTWVLGFASVLNEDDELIELNEPRYYGFILVSVPREILEAQISELLLTMANPVSNQGRSASKEQNAAFDYVKEHFFELF